MMPYKKVAFYTLGCKLNFSETSTISRLFEDKGYTKVTFEEPADVYVINTCSVTENADKKCQRIVRQALKNNADAKVAVTGCYAQLKPQEVANIPGVTMVAGANEKFEIQHLIDSIEEQETAAVHAQEIKHTREFVPAYSIGDRTRSFLKVQDGCDYFCSFCTIPLARGRSRSASVAATIAQAKKVGDTAIKEVVLTGVNIGDFGNGTDENFYDLVQELDTIDTIDRIRISSIEPNLLSNDIISFVAQSQRFMPHFHIPLQSGSNKLLEQMRRRYNKELYADRVTTIKQLMPHCCIGVDVIVGFPGESDDDFLETYHFLNELDVSYLHVFTYSERANTTAVRMGEVVPIHKRRERSKQLRILSEKKRRFFYEQYVGQTAQVLFEAEQKEGFIHGFTENYIKVVTPYQQHLANTLQHVTLEKITIDGEMKAALAPSPVLTE